MEGGKGEGREGKEREKEREGKKMKREKFSFGRDAVFIIHFRGGLCLQALANPSASE